MNMRILASTILGMLLLVGCIPVALTVANITIPGSIYFHPVKGPIFDQNPTAAVRGSANGVGSMSLTLPSGESCKGNWDKIPQTQTETSLSTSWDLVYGQGFFVKVVQGTKFRAKATLIGDKGTEIHAEFFRYSEVAPVQGVANDAAGNVYKVTN